MPSGLLRLGAGNGRRFSAVSRKRTRFLLQESERVDILYSV